MTEKSLTLLIFC